MNWQEIYRSRCMDADSALQAVQTGHKVLIACAASQPESLLPALARRIKEIDQVTINHCLPMDRQMPYLTDELMPKIRHVNGFVGGAIRDYVHKGAGEYAPTYLKDMSDFFVDEYQPDVLMTQVGPPDKHGFCNMGITIIYLKRAIQKAPIVIAEVNENMPRVHGEGFIHVSEISHFVKNDFAVRQVPRPKLSETEIAIGGHVAGLIKDEDCLQLGIGSIPDAVCGFLKNKRGLGIHSEMFSDGVMDLVLEGAVDNKHKTLHEGKMVATFVMGTRAFYDFVDDNPSILLTPVEYSNNPTVIGKNKNLVSVNSSVSVDLMGQAASESIGTMQISGVGGQVDFIRGAANSPGGRAILAFPSTGGSPGSLQSRIVAQLPMGTPISTNRNDIDYVVTEYGVAKLKYKTMRERAQELIQIAHPDFRPELRDTLKKMTWF